jgi:hypothetical protein
MGAQVEGDAGSGRKRDSMEGIVAPIRIEKRPMAELYSFSGSSIRKVRQDASPEPEAQPAGDSERCCAYNRTRERFVSTDVEIGNDLDGSAIARLRSLKSEEGAALWIVPFRGISPASVRFPLDLVFLDSGNVVLDTVESFPMNRAGPSSFEAASLLVLPADSVAQGEIRPGDYLVICAPEEMKRLLQSLREAEPSAPSAGSARFGPSTVRQEDAVGAQTDRPIRAPCPPPGEAGEGAPQETAAERPGQRQTNARPGTPTREWKKKESKNWLMRLIVGETPDPRFSTRESVPGLIAYFFTGGTPQQNPVRDISLSGIYILTSERWYIGTIVRVTLTDRHNPTAERSITVNAKVVRWGDDGVGLEFVLAGGSNAGVALGEDAQTRDVNLPQIHQFIRNLKSAQA